MIALVFRNLSSDKKYNSKYFEKILNTATKELKLKKKLELSINLVREGKIRELNKKYRNKDKVTDVLSFPMSEKLKVNGYKLPDTDLGDIFICLSIAKKEAKRENINIEKKIAQLTVHGFLHILGYDHERSKRDEKIMFSLENKIMKKLN